MKKTLLCILITAVLFGTIGISVSATQPMVPHEFKIGYSYSEGEVHSLTEAFEYEIQIYAMSNKEDLESLVYTCTGDGFEILSHRREDSNIYVTVRYTGETKTPTIKLTMQTDYYRADDFIIYGYVSPYGVFTSIRGYMPPLSVSHSMGYAFNEYCIYLYNEGLISEKQMQKMFLNPEKYIDYVPGRGLEAWQITLISVASVAVVASGAVATILLIHRRKKKTQAAEETTE